MLLSILTQETLWDNSTGLRGKKWQQKYWKVLIFATSWSPTNPTREFSYGLKTLRRWFPKKSFCQGFKNCQPTKQPTGTWTDLDLQLFDWTPREASGSGRKEMEDELQRFQQSHLGGSTIAKKSWGWCKKKRHLPQGKSYKLREKGSPKFWKFCWM